MLRSAGAGYESTSRGQRGARLSNWTRQFGQLGGTDFGATMSPVRPAAELSASAASSSFQPRSPRFRTTVSSEGMAVHTVNLDSIDPDRCGTPRSASVFSSPRAFRGTTPCEGARRGGGGAARSHLVGTNTPLPGDGGRSGPNGEFSQLGSSSTFFRAGAPSRELLTGEQRPIPVLSARCDSTTSSLAPDNEKVGLMSAAQLTSDVGWHRANEWQAIAVEVENVQRMATPEVPPLIGSSQFRAYEVFPPATEEELARVRSLQAHVAAAKKMLYADREGVVDTTIKASQKFLRSAAHVLSPKGKKVIHDLVLTGQRAALRGVSLETAASETHDAEQAMVLAKKLAAEADKAAKAAAAEAKRRAAAKSLRDGKSSREVPLLELVATLRGFAEEQPGGEVSADDEKRMRAAMASACSAIETLVIATQAARNDAEVAETKAKRSQSQLFDFAASVL